MAQQFLPVLTGKDSKLEDCLAGFSLTLILGTRELAFYKKPPACTQVSLLREMLSYLEI